MFRAAEYSTTELEAPATDGRYIGDAFQQQTRGGSNLNDRTDYLAGIESGDASSQVTVPDFGDDSYEAGNGALIVQSPVPKSWYATLREFAGFPLPIMSDKDYGNATNDVVGDTINTPTNLISRIGEWFVNEKPLQIPSRDSVMPSEQSAVRPWDTTMGAYPWSGDKVSLARPLATTPLVFDSDLYDALPSPTGTNRADIPNTPSMYPQPLTYRVPAEPWDTADDGYYVDSGS